jgi:hypothetical protein
MFSGRSDECRDLTLGDEEFIVQLKGSGVRKLRGRQAIKMLAMARSIGEIEPHQGWIA